jgi:hypothetical protein
VAPTRVVIGAQCSEGAEPMGEVTIICVIQGNGPGPAVEAGGRKDAVGEVMCEVGVPFKEFL